MTPLTRRRNWPGLVLAALMALAAANARAMTLVESNIVDLLNESDAIVVGTVQNVTDGLDAKGVPFTEITLEISETIRGDASGTYVFRQFGLLKPRLTADGKKKMMPAPEGFPRYAEGEHVVLFLHPKAAWTGLRTTVGLGQGKFTVGPGRLMSDTGNVGLFRNLNLSQGLATENDKRLLTTDTGAVSPEGFLSFVRRAVKEHWVENGRLVRTGRAMRVVQPGPVKGVGTEDEAPAAPAPDKAPQSLLPTANQVTGRSGQ